MRSIRSMLTAKVIVGVVLVNISVSIITALGIRWLDLAEFDETLVNKAKLLATLTIREGNLLEVDFAGEYMPEFEREIDPEYFQFRLPDHSVIERSDRLGDRDLPFYDVDSVTPVYHNIRLPDGRWGRIVQIALPPRISDTVGTIDVSRFHIPDHMDPETTFVILSVARSREGLDHFLNIVYLTLVGRDLLLGLLVWFIVTRLIRRELDPIEALNRQIEEIGPDDLLQPVHLPDAPFELQTILSALNSFMTRLHAVLTRERRFSSDVAHELRTLVAEFRSGCEVGAKWSDDAALVKRRFEGLMVSAVSMEKIVNDLLELSRCDRGDVEVSPSRMAVSPLIDACWNRVKSLAEEKNLTLQNEVPASAVIYTDVGKLEMILMNLIDNAVTYSCPGTPVVFSGYVKESALQLSIGNQTTELKSEDVEHMSERFWRKDTARTSGGHAGLGLSIVEAFSEILHIDLEMLLRDKNTFMVSLSIPSHKES